jgi:opacity protein-like surface antigen
LHHSLSRPLVLAGAFLACALPLAATRADEARFYLRGGLGGEWSTRTNLRDIDCTQAVPPALFGCGPGIDDRALGARGDFGRSVTFDLGFGYRVLPALRGELLLTYRPGLAFSGRANFLATPQPQPVTADADSFSAMAVGYIDLAGLGLPSLGPVEPFIGGGVGVARHDIDRVTFAFPGLSTNATTVIQGGESTRFAYMLTAGGAVRLSDRITLDIAYRYSDLGVARTAAGPAVITRTSFTRTLDIAGTQADLVTHGVSASLRAGF